MRLAHEAYALEEIGEAADQVDMGMANNGKAYEALISTLYSDKYGSPVRELCANASDAQIRAGWKQPFFVHCPTELRPELAIRDYGCGMDHAKVMKLYSVLFESDKGEDDKEVGTYGLGSKTPFAYPNCNQFAVSCYDGATVRHYVVVRSSGNGKPKIVLTGEEPCAEPTGVRVSFAVEPAHFHEFEKAIRYVALAHDPVFESNLKLATLPKPLFTGEGWHCYENSSLPNTWNVRQGCVIYPVTSTGGLSLPSDGGNRKYLLDCPIGTIPVTLSREMIEYTPPLIDYLNERLASVTAEARDIVWNKIKKIKPVGLFFESLTAWRPHFVEADSFVHPESGLSAPEFHIPGPACLFDADFDGSTQRWTYGEVRALKFSRASTNNRRGKIFVIEDIEPLLLPPDHPDYRSDPVERAKGLSLLERRRLTRLTRAWAATHDTFTVTLALGVKFSDKFWKSIYPESEIVRITVADLRLAIPRLPKPVKSLTPTAIRGVSLFVGTEEFEVYDVNDTADDDDPGRANSVWIGAQEWRHNESDVRAFLKTFLPHLTHIYVASAKRQPLVEAARIMTLDQALSKLLPEGLFASELSLLLDRYDEDKLGEYGRRLLADNPAGYAKLASLKTPFGRLMRTQETYLRSPFGLIHKYADRQTLKRHVAERAKPSPYFKALKRALDDCPSRRDSRKLATLMANKANGEKIADSVEGVYAFVRATKS